jgi:hypothetical protein
MDSNLLWELDLGRKRGHVAQGSGCLSAGVRGVFRGSLKLVFGIRTGHPVYRVHS